MSSAALMDEQPVTIGVFDAFIGSQRDDSLWELVAGRIVAMTNPTELHEQIVANLGAPLKLQMDRQECRVYFGGMRVQFSEASQGLDKPRPDLLVRCGPALPRSFVTDPLVVAEVLSPSTMDSDRGPKLAFYKTLPTLRHMVLLYQDQVRIEHYRLLDTGWTRETLTELTSRLVLEAVGFETTLQALYFGTGIGAPG